MAPKRQSLCAHEEQSTIGSNGVYRRIVCLLCKKELMTCYFHDVDKVLAQKVFIDYLQLSPDARSEFTPTSGDTREENDARKKREPETAVTINVTVVQEPQKQ